MKHTENEPVIIKETVQTTWEELGISNDFLFGKVMQNPELCKELLQRILPDLKIDHIEYPELQKNIDVDRDARSVRLDRREDKVLRYHLAPFGPEGQEPPLRRDLVDGK